MLRTPLATLALIAGLATFAAPDRADAISAYIGTGLGDTIDGQSVTVTSTGSGPDGVEATASGLVDLFGPNPGGIDIFNWTHSFDVSWDSATGTFSGGFSILEPGTSNVYLSGTIYDAMIDDSVPDDITVQMWFTPVASAFFNIATIVGPIHGEILPVVPIDGAAAAAILAALSTPGGSASFDAFIDYDFEYQPVPLPSSLGFLVLGFGVLAGARKMRRT